MKEAQGATIRAKITWELEGEKCSKYFFQKLEKRKNADQAIRSFESRQNGKILKDQQEILTEVKTFYEQLCVQKNSVQERIEINPSPSVIGRNDQNQSNKQFNFNHKCCEPKGSNMQCFQETRNHKKLRMQSPLILVVQKKISPKNRCECNQKITITEIERAITCFENNKSPSNDGLPAEFYKTFNEILKTDLHKLYIEISLLGEMPRSMRQAVCTVISCLYKTGDREEITNWRSILLLNYDNKIYTKILANKIHPT